MKQVSAVSSFSISSSVPAHQGTSPLHTHTPLSVYLENPWPQVRMYCTALHAQYWYLLSFVFKTDLFIQPAVCWKLHSCRLHPASSCFPTKVSAAPLPYTHSLQLGSTSAAVPQTTTPPLCCEVMNSNQDLSGHFTVSQSHFGVASSTALS